MSALDKSARLAQESADARAQLAARTRKLDPEFPFIIIPFDEGFFGLPLDPSLNSQSSTLNSQL